MNIIYQLFYNSTQIFTVGDNFITKDGYESKVVNNINTTIINTTYSKYNIAKIPFKFNRNDKIDDAIVDAIKEQFSKSSSNIQAAYKQEFEFIITYKIINNSVFNFYKKIKDLEFIPKTYNHLLLLYNSIYK